MSIIHTNTYLIKRLNLKKKIKMLIGFFLKDYTLDVLSFFMGDFGSFVVLILLLACFLSMGPIGDTILNFAFMAYCDNDTPACFADITYGFYKVFADINSVPKKVIPLKDDFSLSVDDYIGQKGTIFIANPNAPTGLLLPLTEIERLLMANKDNMVV